MKKRTLALVLALMMLVSALPLAVSADGPVNLEKDKDGVYLVKKYDAFCDFLRANQPCFELLEFRLAADVTQSDSLNDRSLLLNYCRITLDLNGHTLSRSCKSTDKGLFELINNSELTVYDSSSSGTGRLEFTNTATNSAYVIRSTASAVTIESGDLRLDSKGAVILAEGSEVIIRGGVFEAPAGSSYGIEARRTIYTSRPPTVLIYDGVFRTAGTTVQVYQAPNFKFQKYFPDTPILAVLDGEFYTDYQCGFSYVPNGIGKCFIYGGLIPAQVVNPQFDRDFADGTAQTHVTADGDKDYIRVSRPMWLTAGKIGLGRFDEAVMRDYLAALKEKNGSDYQKYKNEIDEYLAAPACGSVSERNLDPVQLKVSVARSDVKMLRLYSSTPANEADWKDGPWTLEASMTPVPGDVYFTVERPKEKTKRFYRLDAEYTDGTTWSDHVAIEFEEAKYTMSGTPFPTMNDVRYGNTLFCGIVDYPSEIPVESLCYEWFVDGKSVGTEKKIKLDDPSWVGKKLTVRVTSTVAEGAIVSSPVTIAKGRNSSVPAMPGVKADMDGTVPGNITIYGLVPEQEYLLSKKNKQALTDDDWKNSIRVNNPGIELDPGFISSQFGFEPKNGDTVYVHTRFYATETLLTGTEVLTASVYLGETVYLSSITFPDAINGTIYLPYNGYEQTYEINYALNPGNANSGGDIRWRVNSPLTLEDPTAPLNVKDSKGDVTVRVTGVGTTTLTAYYQTSIQTDYGRVTVVVYDPKNVGTNLLKPAEPLQDVTIYAGNGYSAALPKFLIEPTVAPTYSWYFTRGTTYGYEKVSDVGFATIDTATGEISTSATGKVTVSLFADNTLVDSYELTVVEKPDDCIALEALFAESSEITLNVGDKRELKVFKSPANATADKFTFTSSDPSVAEVSANGVVRARSEGTAEITVSSPADGVSVKVKITVKSIGAALYTPGDANGDGKINAKDVIAIMKHIVGKTPKDFVEAAADYDGNGKINAKDVTGLMKYIVAHQGS